MRPYQRLCNKERCSVWGAGCVVRNVQVIRVTVAISVDCKEGDIRISHILLERWVMRIAYVEMLLVCHSRVPPKPLGDDLGGTDCRL